MDPDKSITSTIMPVPESSSSSPTSRSLEGNNPNCDETSITKGNASTSTADASSGVGNDSCTKEEEQRQVQIWNGEMEWYAGEEELGQPSLSEGLSKGSRQSELLQNQRLTLPCTIYGNAVNGIPEVTTTDLSRGSTWGKKLVMHLMPKAHFRRLEVEYIRNTKQVNLTFGNSPHRPQLNRLMRTGRYAGCVHIPSSSEAKSPQLKPEMNVILLLYSKGKQAVMGFVPNEQSAFVKRLLEVIPEHLSRIGSGTETEKGSESILDSNAIGNVSVNTQRSISNSLENLDISNEMLSNEGEENQVVCESSVETGNTEVSRMETDVVAEDVEIENAAISYWDYNLLSEFKLSRQIAQTPDTEFNSLGKRKKTKFLKGCKWAPDGSCLISNSDDDIMRLFNVPESLYQVKDWHVDEDMTRCELKSVLQIKEGGQIYDYCWYPLMSSYDPVSSCFLTTSTDSPLHLWDAFTGKLRASYLAYNNVDEVTSARSVAFDPLGENIYCGFDSVLRTFNITRPGRQCTERRLKHPQISELSQSGIISCIAVNPSLRSVQALGSYLKTVGLYYDDGSVLCILQGHLGGVTHLKFSNDGTKLFSGGRKDSRLICWDMRHMGEEYKIYDRVVETNQRVYFDVTPNDKYLITGGTDGRVKVWDLANESADAWSFDAHSDCVNGVSLNPFLPILATASGQRHFQPFVNDSSDDDDEDDTEMLDKSSSKRVDERNIKLWKFC